MENGCENVREDVYLLVDVITAEDSSVLKKKKSFKTEQETNLLGLDDLLSSLCLLGL